MSSSPTTAPGDRAPKAPLFTPEGLPLDHARFGTAPATADAGDGGPARRVEVRPPRLLAAPSHRPLPAAKRPPPPAAGRAPALVVGPNQGSLIDADDDAIVDYFGAADGAPHSKISSSPAEHSSSAWDVRESQVPTLPSFYPLEKSAVFVPQGSAPAVASRIASVIQARSIAAQYDAPNAKADCVSKSLVEFRIRLYRGRGEYKHGIIAEVQRRCGFNLSYTQDVYAILDAAEGKAVEDRGEATPMYYEEEGCGSDDEDMDALEHTAGFASLRVISDILCPQAEAAPTAERRDLALASLASLTSVDRMGPTAAKMSSELLTSDAHSALRQVLRSNLLASSDSPRSDLQSLEILANAAASLPDKAPLAAFLFQNDRRVLLELVARVERARSHPRAAELACAILEGTLRADEEATAMPSPLRERLLAALMEAVGCGGECHAGLEGRAQLCLGRLL